MARSFYSASWHRVAELKPRLKSHVTMHRKMHRGEIWFVLQDNQSGKFNRLPIEAFRILSLMNGNNTMDDIWEKCGALLGARQPGQDELIKLLSMLHNGDLLLSGQIPDMQELSERSSKIKKSNRTSRWHNPMAMRLRLFDPDAFLDATHRYFDWVYSPAGALLWCSCILAGLTALVLNFDAIGSSTLEQVLSATNLFAIALLYPFIKGIHELGHAYAVKRWGGRVHEIGIMFLALMPMPYVDASASIAFPSKWHRMIVAGAGIAVEMILAAIGIIIWAMVEDGIVKAMAMNVAIIGGVSTLLFNGNPLMRFDGYFVLADWIESPNLGKRSSDFVLNLIKRYGLSMQDAESPHMARGEKGFFAFYAISSLLYRLVSTLGIALYISGKYFFVGVALALFMFWSTVLKPITKGLNFLIANPSLDQKRRLAFSRVGLTTAILMILLFAIPLPYGTYAIGILGPQSDHSFVRAASGGTINKRFFDAPAAVSLGAHLYAMQDQDLTANAAITEAKVEELEVLHSAASTTDQARAAVFREELDRERDRLLELQTRIEGLNVTATKSGRFVPVHFEQLRDRYLKRGTLLGHVVSGDDLVIKAVVPHTSVENVWQRTRGVRIRQADNVPLVLDAEVTRAQPEAIEVLPSAVLSSVNGGPFATDPSDEAALHPLDALFEITVKAAAMPDDVRLGQLIYVYFEHPAEPVGWRLVRSEQQLFLRHFQL